MPANLDTADTIAAIASPPGPGLRGIVRVGGPESWRVALGGFDDDAGHLSVRPARPVRRAGRLRVEGLRSLVPAAVVLWPGPGTYTGQDLAELHMTGSPPVLEAALAGMLARGARLAGPGEFTLRAFLAGRIDLTRAEAVLGVIEARSPAQLDAALRQLGGGLAGPIAAARDRLLDTLAHLEAGLDFVDEADVDPIGRARLADELEAAASTLLGLAGRLRDRDRPGHAPRVVLVGPPNAGKSRLFNALAGRDGALVSPAAGTTRDYLVAPCDCDGLLVDLVDTAGIQPAATAIEGHAQSHRASQAGAADLILDCRGVDSPAADVPPGDVATLRVGTKSDLGPPDDPTALATSAATGDGIAALRSAIATALRRGDPEADAATGTSARCRDSLARAGESLRRASEAVLLGGGDELVAIDVRQAVDDLGAVLGVDVGDEVLDRVFRRFCIGK